MLSLGLEATAHYGLAAPDIQIGDVALFSGLIAALDLPPAWKRRLVKDFNRKTNLAQDLDRLVLGRQQFAARISGRAGGARRLRSEGRACAGHRFAVDRRHQRGRRPFGRRDRRAFPRAVRARRQRQAAARRARLIERFLAIAGDPDEAAAELRALAGDGNMTTALAPALDLFESRSGFLAARGIDLKRVRFSTAFGRGFDYYTGFVFELTDPTRTGDPLVAGGRYDGLLTRLGAPAPIAAVGFAVWIERLAVYGGAS